MPSPFTWDITAPAGSSAISLGDNQIRTDKTTVRDILRTLVPFGTPTVGWRQVQITNDQYLTNNALWDGAAWQRDDVSVVSSYLRHIVGGGFELAHVAAAANPITWTVYLTLTSTLITFGDALNIAFNATTGTKIGTATTQKLAFYNATPIVQPTAIGVAMSGIASSSAGTALAEPDVAYVQVTWQQNMRRIQDRLNEIRTTLTTLGLNA